jgi:YidC/Oxa1 family membrane protein insertase
MERRVLLAITLSFLVLFLFQRFVMPPPPPDAAVTATGATSPAGAMTPTGAPAANTSAAAPATPVAPAAPSAPAIASTVSEATAREIIVETSKVKAVFSNHGAKIVHWILKEYRTDKGEPLDLVPAGAGPNAIRPFTLMVEDQALSGRMNEALYRATVNGAPAGTMVDATASAQTIVFETASADGLSVKKTFTLEPTSYIIGFAAVV